MAKTETVVLTSGTSWTVPNYWNNSNNSVACLGAGGGGGGGGYGGGGGAYATTSNITLTLGGTVSYTIGAGGGLATAGGDTTFNSSAIVAKGGTYPTGGQASASTGATKYSGGDGGAGGNASGVPGGGGGGAAGNGGAGSNGGAGTSGTGVGGAGGAGYGGAAGGAGGTAGNAGGGGSSGTYSGGGGGGGGYLGGAYPAYGAGAAGGNYGAGGGGASWGSAAGGSGTQGVIIASWYWENQLPATGALNAIAINTALKKLTTAAFSLDDADVRAMAGKATGAISYYDFYGKADIVKADIVRDGLIMNVDAANPSSYSGSGTTWTDLSGSGNHMTLIGSPTLSGGVLQFNGITQLAQRALNLSSGTSTIMCGSRYSGATRGRVVNALSNNWLLGHWNNSVANYYAEGTIALGGGGTDTTWRTYAGTASTATDVYNLYINGALNVGPSNGGAQGPNGIVIARYPSGSETSICEVSFVLAYNRVLTAAEVLQNHNFYKSRFGI